MKRLTALVLLALLSLAVATGPAAAQGTPQAATLKPGMDLGKLKSRLINVPTGSPLTVRTRDGARVSGKLVEMTNDAVQIQALSGGNIENRTLAYTDIAGLSVGPRKGGMSKLKPLLTAMSLLGTVGSLTAALK